LKPEGILELSEEEYQQIMSLAQQMGREKIIKDNSFFAFLFNTTRKYLNISIRSLDVLPTGLISLFYGNLFHNIYPDHDENFASILMFMGICLSRLTNQGIKKAIRNLKQAIECLDEAAAIFKIVKADLNYARTLSNKGVTLLTLAERGVDTIENLKQSIKCYNEAVPILIKEKAEIDYARIQMNKGVSLRKLAEQGVDVERNFSSAMELYKEAEGVFLEKESLLGLIMARANRIVGLWWRFQQTKEEVYLNQARRLCEEALKIAPDITHPARKDIKELLNRIYKTIADIHFASKKEPREEIERELANIVREEMLKEFAPIKDTVSRIDMRTVRIEEKVEQVDKKLDEILNSIRNQTMEIIDKIKESGEKVSEEVAKGFTSLADDLEGLKEKKRNDLLEKLLEELCRLLKDSSFKSKLLNESPPEKRGLIKSISQRIGDTAKEVAGHMPAALLLNQLCLYINELSAINPSLVWTSVIVAFIAFKSRIFKR